MTLLNRLFLILTAEILTLAVLRLRADPPPKPPAEYRPPKAEPIPQWVKDWKRQFPGGKLGAWPD